MKSAILAGAAALALTASGAWAAPSGNTVLWNQNANFGGSVNSQEYELAMEQYNDAAADDFVVPVGQTWRVAEVDVTGSYVVGSGPASSVTITFWKPRRNLPYRLVRGYTPVSCTDNAGSFQCVLPKKARLQAGTYWLSVVANCNSQSCGQWNWTENTTVTGNEAVWQNPGGGWNQNGCKNGIWWPVSTCFGTATDLAFDLIGTP